MYTKKQVEVMVRAARVKGMFVRIFYGAKRPQGGYTKGDWAVEGMPTVHQNYLIYPAGSFEVLETGKLDGPSANTQKRAGKQLIPFNEIRLLELSLYHS